MTSLAHTSGDGLQVTIEQLSGRTWASVQRLRTSDSRLKLKTPTATDGDRRRPRHRLRDGDRGRDRQPVTTIKTTEGEVLVRAEAGGETSITAGNQVTVPEGGQAPPAQPQPPTPRRQIQGTANVGYPVIDPHGRTCRSSGNTPIRQIPRCDVQGGAVTIGDVVSGAYTFAARAAAPAPDASNTVQGFRATTRDFGATFTRALNVGDLVRTTLAVTVGSNGVLSAGQFTPARKPRNELSDSVGTGDRNRPESAPGRYTVRWYVRAGRKSGRTSRRCSLRIVSPPR